MSPFRRKKNSTFIGRLGSSFFLPFSRLSKKKERNARRFAESWGSWRAMRTGKKPRQRQRKMFPPCFFFESTKKMEPFVCLATRKEKKLAANRSRRRTEEGRSKKKRGEKNRQQNGRRVLFFCSGHQNARTAAATSRPFAPTPSLDSSVRKKRMEKMSFSLPPFFFSNTEDMRDWADGANRVRVVCSRRLWKFFFLLFYVTGTPNPKASSSGRL